VSRSLFKDNKVGYSKGSVKSPQNGRPFFVFVRCAGAYIQVMLRNRFRLILLSLAVFLATGSATRGNEVPSGGLFRLHFDQPAYVARADSVLQSTRKQLQTLLNNGLVFQCDVHLVETQDGFDSLIGGRFPDWGAAVAIPLWQRIVIKSPDRFPVNRPLEQLLRHEYAHLALAHRIGLGEVPRWFNEGLAMMVSMEWSWENSLTMGEATVIGGYIPLDEIERMNRFSESRVRLAYAQSYLAVQFMFEQYGVEAVNVFLDEIARGRSTDHALMASVGSNSADFERELHVYWHDKFNFLTLLVDSMYFWLGLAVILIIGAALAYRRRRDYYRKWDEEEKLASTDFDYGDPENPEEIDDDEPWRH